MIYVGHGDRRLRNRDDIARAAGVPVIATLPADRPRRVDDWHELLHKWTPGPSENLMLRHAYTLLGHAAPRTPVELMIVALPGDAAALAAAVKMAVFAADAGAPTMLIIASPDRSCARLRSACVAGRARVHPRPRLSMPEGEGGPGAAGPAPGTGMGVTITIATLDGSSPSLPSPGSPATTTLLTVSSGFATSDSIAAVVLACADSEHPVSGVLLANPDPDDHTTGMLGLSAAPGPVAGLSPPQLAIADSSFVPPPEDDAPGERPAAPAPTAEEPEDAATPRSVRRHARTVPVTDAQTGVRHARAETQAYPPDESRPGSGGRAWALRVRQAAPMDLEAV